MQQRGFAQRFKSSIAAESAAEILLQQYHGYPLIPNGHPAGVLPYMVGNFTRTKYYHADQLPNTHNAIVTEISEEVYREHPGEAEYFSCDIPGFDPDLQNPKHIYYGVIITDCSGIAIPTLAKGAQDLLAEKDGVTRVVALGQILTLNKLFTMLTGRRIDIPDFSHIEDAGERWDNEINFVHVAVISELLRQGYRLNIETACCAAIRETLEEHGWDCASELANVIRIDEFVESALSQRKIGEPIPHYIYAAMVTGLDTCKPSFSTNTQEKNLRRFGKTYIERGAFMTLEDLRQQVNAADRGVGDIHGITSALGKVEMLTRIERAIIRNLREESIYTRDNAGFGQTAISRQTIAGPAPIPDELRCEIQITRQKRGLALA